MSKGRRKRERAERRRLKVLEGGGEPNAPAAAVPFPREGVTPLEKLPEYLAHMQAWREAGCPPGPGQP